MTRVTRKIISVSSYSLFCIILISLFISLSPVALAAGLAEAESALQSAEKSVNDMSAAGFAITQINESLGKAKTLLLSGEYDSVLLLTNQINSTKEKAFDVSKKIDDTDTGMVELAGMDVADMRENLRLATIEFYKENYLAAESYVNKALELLEAKKAGISVEAISKPENVLVGFVRDNQPLFAVLIAILILYRLVFYKKIRAKKMRHRLKELDEIEKRTKDAMKKTQEAYFAHGIMDKYDYHVKMNTYRKHMAGIKKERLIINRELSSEKYKKYKALKRAKV